MASKAKGHFLVVGFVGCGYYDRAVEAAKTASVELTTKQLPTRDAYLEYIGLPSVAKKIGEHTSSPVVFHDAVGVGVVKKDDNLLPSSTSTFLGGSDQLLQFLSVPPETSETMSPSAVLEYFHKKQRDGDFVLWILFRGLW
jgi:hypothetical protein